MMTDKSFMEWAEGQLNITPFIGHPAESEVDIVTVGYPQRSPVANMDPSKISNTQFIDLKSRNNFALRDNVVAVNEKRFPPLTRATNRVPHVLPNPTIGVFGSNDVKKQKVTAKYQSSKVFDEDLSPIPIVDDDDNFGISLRKGFNKPQAFTTPATKYKEGEVKITTKDALVEMMHKLCVVKQRDTGCIINEACDPECLEYREEMHFLSCKFLGHGSFGEVDLCYDSKTQKPFVRKTIKKCDLRASEVIAPTTFDHPNITKFFGLVQRDSSEKCLQVKMELYLEYGGESLTKYYLDGRRFDQKQIRNLTKQGLAGLVHMDRYNIVHLDIKPENVCILDKNGTLQLKITDFGSSRLPIDRLEFVGVTPEYMAPEMCQLYLQRQVALGLDWGLEESDITGKVDVFALALVTMYMYKGYHLLVKVINNGNSTYENMDTNRRRSLHVNLMIQMAKDTDNDFFVQNLIPDECSLDMRDLLIEMTQHKHASRASARHAFEQIEVFEKKRKSTINAEMKTNHDIFIQKIPPLNLPYLHDTTFSKHSIPDIAEDCMGSETGPVKNRTIGLLRRKLQPYEKGSHQSKGSKYMVPMSPQQEMVNLKQEIASKKLQMPATPIAAFEDLCLEQALTNEPVQRIAGTTERNAPLTQPSMDTTPAVMVDMRGQIGVEESHAEFSSDVNDVSLSDRRPEVVATTAGQKRIHIPVEVLMKLLKKKAQQTSVQKEPEVQPPVIDLREVVGNRASTPSVQHPCQPTTDMPMEESDEALGNLPNFL